MLAMALERNTAQNHHFVVTFGLFEGLLQDLLGVLPVAGKVFGESFDQAARGFAQPVAIGVFANPAQNVAKRGLRIDLRRNVITAIDMIEQANARARVVHVVPFPALVVLNVGAGVLDHA